MAVLETRMEGHTFVMTLNRPEAMNSFSSELIAAVGEAWKQVMTDGEIRTVILTGAGDRAFSAGADLKEMASRNASDGPQRNTFWDQGEPQLYRGLELWKPVIAAVNGYALGGGCETAMACDIRVASENAKFGSFEVRRGYHHGDGGIARLVNTCGSGFALEMLLTGEPVDAERAQRANLVSRVVPHGELMAEAEKVAAQVLRNDTWAIRSAKETILDVIGRRLDDQLRIDCLNGYSGVANPTVRGLLEQFYAKRDRGRAGKRATEI